MQPGPCVRLGIHGLAVIALAYYLQQGWILSENVNDITVKYWEFTVRYWEEIFFFFQVSV